MQGIIGRRSDGLSKMVTYSFILHFFFMGTLVLSKDLWGPRIPDFQSYNVSLVPTGMGLPLLLKSGGSEKNSPSTIVSSKPNRRITSTKKPLLAPPVRSNAPVQKDVAGGVPPSLSGASTSLEASPKASKEVFIPEDDPERLPDWKKKSRSMKLPEIPQESPTQRNSVPLRKTAKISLPKRKTTSLRKKIPLSVAPSAKDSKKSSSFNLPQPQPLEQANSTQLEQALSPNVNTVPSVGIEGRGLAPSDGFSSNGASASIQSPLRGGFGEGMIGTGSASVGQSLFGFPSYIQKINNKISGHWSPPPVTIRESHIGVVIRFDINKRGDLNKATVVVEKSSGNSFFDQAAMRAVYSAHPLPPLPGRFSDNKLTIHFSFTVREDS